MTFITVSDIFITVTVINKKGATDLSECFNSLFSKYSMRDHAKSGALTEVTFYILLSLYLPRHGYGIMQFIEEKTDGRLSLGAGTLYGALTTLQEKGWISLYDNHSGRKKEYLITDAGRKIAEKELQRLQELTHTALEIMGGVY